MHVPRDAVHGDGVAAIADGVHDRALGIELLALLVVVRHLHVGAVPHGAGVGRQVPQQQPQQRRLSRPVGADKADAVAAHHPDGQILDD